MSDSVPPPDNSTALALLAAGRGRRFGGGKLMQALDGEPLWRWAAEAAEMAGFSQRLIVTNEEAIAASASDSGWQVFPNPEADEGLASSIRVAAAAAEQLGAERLVIALADMPFVEIDHLRRLAAASQVVFTHYPDGREGVPAAFPQGGFAALQDLAGDRGAGAIAWPERASLRPVDPVSLTDIDTPDELERAQALAVRLSRATGR